MILEKAYAKINLALEVMDLIDGYHKVNNIMIPISLYDEIELEKNDEILIVDDPFKGKNIMEKAASLFFEYTKIDGGVRIILKKNIPSEAGLAGGSSDGAATLRGLNKLYDANLTNDELRELAKKLGSDVPFFIETKTAICTNRGEEVNKIECNLDETKILIIKPYTGLSTKLVYQNYKYDGESKKENIDNILKALKNNNSKLLKENLFNDLSLPALNLNKDMQDIYIKLSLVDLNPFVSGSGPTMFILNPKESDIELVKTILDVEKCIILSVNTLK